MSASHDEFKEIDTPSGMRVDPCPVCGSAGSLWQYLEVGGSASKVVMCVNGEAFGPQDGSANEGCLLYMPPRDFYKPTMREAVKHWNEYAKALNVQRRARNWQNAKVLRAQQPKGTTP